MTKDTKKMDKTLINSSWFTKVTIEVNKQNMKSNKQEYDEKLIKLIEDFKEMLASTITSMMDHINNSKSLPAQSNQPKPQEPTTAVPSKKRDPPSDDGQSTKISGMLTLKHDISLPKFYELLIKTELKVETTLDLKNLYNHIKICINAVNRLWGDLLHAY